MYLYRYVFTIVSYLIGVFIFATIVGESCFTSGNSPIIQALLLLRVFFLQDKSVT